jgi:hypothetical protein
MLPLDPGKIPQEVMGRGGYTLKIHVVKPLPEFVNAARNRSLLLWTATVLHSLPIFQWHLHLGTQGTNKVRCLRRTRDASREPAAVWIFGS